MSKNTPVRIGVLGCARVFERRFAPAIGRATNATLHAVASRSLNKATEVAARFGAPSAYGSYEALLADPDVEAVYIPLPNDLHAHWTLQALAAGKHVLCDKPLTLSVAAAEEMHAAARAANRRLMEGFMYRHHPQHTKVFSLLQENVIGELVGFRGVFTYPAGAAHTGIRFNPEQGGGALLDVGVYPINAARWFFGAEPEIVFATGRICPNMGVDLHTAAVLQFPGGRTASVVAGFDQSFTTRYELVGAEGTITAERAFQVGENGVRVLVRTNNADTDDVYFFPHTDAFQAEIEHFAACVRDPNHCLAPAEDGLLQTKAVCAVFESLRTGQSVRVH